jgi:integrase
VGTIIKRKTGSGDFAFTARVRRRGYPHQTATFSRKTDAAAWIAQQEAKIRQGLHLDDPVLLRRTLTEAIDRYLEEFNPDINRRSHLRRWREALGARFLTAIDDVAINDAMASFKPTTGRTASQKLSGESLRVHLSSLSAVYTAAKCWGWIKKSPVRDIKRPSPNRGRVRYLTGEELERLKAACKESSYKPLFLIVMLTVSTGMRKEEVLGLKWSDVNLEEGYLILHRTKNGDRRRVSISATVMPFLREHNKVRRIDSDFLFPGKNDSSMVAKCKTPRGERHFDIRKAWEAARARAGLTDFRFHDLRHTAASYLAMNGATPFEIASVLGHRCLSMAQRYAHLSESHVDEVVERMNRRFLEKA